MERDIADSIEQRTAEYASRINAPHASLKTKSSRRNLAMETGITRQAQKPLDRMSSADERVRLENNMVEILNGQTRNSSNRFRSIPHDYTGYKIQIIKSEYPIDKDEIAGMFPEGIWWEETGKSENTYLIGTFSRFQDAVDYFEEKIASIYPNAKIIEFIRGSRL
ncbi:MAG: hypothetical protein HKN76_04360 [Saprospiraceae bacterium]|nr:hypothetical protein [Saprospiraceae bacterium]